MLLQTYNITLLNNMRTNKRKVSQELLEKINDRILIFIYDKNITMLSCKPKENKNVVLLTSMHTEGTVNPTRKTSNLNNKTNRAVDL